MPSSAKCARKALINWVRLPHQKIACPMLHQSSLLLGRLDRYEGYSITSSARADSGGGTSMPSALAVLRLITNSNFVT